MKPKARVMFFSSRKARAKSLKRARVACVVGAGDVTRTHGAGACRGPPAPAPGSALGGAARRATRPRAIVGVAQPRRARLMAAVRARRRWAACMVARCRRTGQEGLGLVLLSLGRLLVSSGVKWK